MSRFQWLKFLAIVVSGNKVKRKFLKRGLMMTQNRGAFTVADFSTQLRESHRMTSTEQTIITMTTSCAASALRIDFSFRYRIRPHNGSNVTATKLLNTFLLFPLEVALAELVINLRREDRVEMRDTNYNG